MTDLTDKEKADKWDRIELKGIDVNSDKIIGWKAKAGKLDEIEQKNKQLNEIVQKIRERLPELIEHQKVLEEVSEPTDDLRAEIEFYQEILGDKND